MAKAERKSNPFGWILLGALVVLPSARPACC